MAGERGSETSDQCGWSVARERGSETSDVLKSGALRVMPHLRL